MGGGKKVTRSQKDPSWNFYYCPYILWTREVCNRRCYDPKGKQTRSGYDYCDTYAEKHRSREHYYWKKQARLASMQVLVGNLEINKNNTTLMSLEKIHPSFLR